MSTMMNRMANSKNEFQGTDKRVLCVCSAGLLRSPTAAEVLQREYGYNTRAAGATEEYALIFADKALIYWADEVVFMEECHKEQVVEMLGKLKLPTHQILDVPDMYARNDDKLIKMILRKYKTDDKSIGWVKR